MSFVIVGVMPAFEFDRWRGKAARVGAIEGVPDFVFGQDGAAAILVPLPCVIGRLRMGSLADAAVELSRSPRPASRIAQAPEFDTA